MNKENSLSQDPRVITKPGDESKIAKYIRIVIICLAGVFGVLFVVLGILGKHAR
jgi:hypothetical protein